MQPVAAVSRHISATARRRFCYAIGYLYKALRLSSEV